MPCTFIKQNGRRCKMKVKGKSLCFHHSLSDKKISIKKKIQKTPHCSKSVNNMWREIEKLNWSKDHDISRVRNQILKLKCKEELSQFVFEKVETLMLKFKTTKLDIGDSSFSDVLAEVVSRGESFYNNITTSILQKMIKNHDYDENFEYVFDLENQDAF